MVFKVPAGLREPLRDGSRVAVGAEEHHVHVVVHTVDTPSQTIKIGYALGADEARGTGDENGLGCHFINILDQRRGSNFQFSRACIKSGFNS